MKHRGYYKNYETLLNDIAWKKRREEVLFISHYRCRKCRSKDNLQVHHKLYIEDTLPWAYPNNLLVCLCDKCHAKWHRENKYIVLSKTQYKEMRESRKTEIGMKQYLTFIYNLFPFSQLKKNYNKQFNLNL